MDSKISNLDPVISLDENDVLPIVNQGSTRKVKISQLNIPSIAGLATTTYVDTKDALKVDKVIGKELSTNDYTTTEKNKLAGIAEGAEVNVNADWNSVSGDSEILNKPSIPSIAGLATVTYVDNQDALKEDDLGNPLVDGYVLSSTIAGVRSWVEQSGGGGGGTWGSITGELSDQTDLQSALDNKVDGVIGKELSTNDFTDALETKLNGIQEGAEVNVNADWNAIIGDAQILNKPAIPTNTSDLTNDGADGVNPFITALDITVDSVNGQTGVVVLDADDIDDTLTTNKFVTAADLTILSNTSGTNTGDQDLSGLVPYTGATSDVNLGTFNITASSLIKEGGLDTQFLKADGSVDNKNYLTANDLPSTLSLYATNVPADVTDYFKLVTTIDDPDYNTIAVDVPTGSITTTNQLIASLISPVNLINGNPGVFNVTTTGNITRLTGSGEAEFFFRIYKRDSGGVETLVGTSGNTIPVINTGYSEFFATAIWNDGIFDVTDSIVLKYYANRITGGSNPTYQFQFGGDQPVRTIVPIPTAVIPNIFLEELADVEDGTASNNDGIFFDSSVSLWKYKSISEVLGYTPENQANKEDVVLDTSAIKYPTNNLVKTNIDLKANIASPTFTGTVTTPAIIVSSETINTIASFDASKNVKSLPTASYPDLTELSYVKGTTSTIQTQLNGKQATLTNPITGTGTTNKIPKFTGSTALGDSQIFDNGSAVGIRNNSPAKLLTVDAGASDYIPIWAKTSFVVSSKFYSSILAGYDLLANQSAQFGFVYDSITPTSSFSHITSYGLTSGSQFAVTASGNVGINQITPTEKLHVVGNGLFSGNVRASNVGIGAAANLASYLNVIANTASVGQLYLPPSAVDYTGTLSGMLWNNTSEWKFYDGVLSSVNRLLKLNGNTALANANALNVVTSTGTGGNLGTLKAEVAFSRFATAISYTILLTDVGFGWVIGVTDTAAARTITLPLANAVPAGWQVTVKDESGGALTNNITIARAGADTIDGATSNVINLNYGSRTIYSDGVSKWFVIASV